MSASLRQRGGQERRDERAALTPLLTIDEVAAVLGVSVRHVRRLVFERRIPYVKWGRYLRFEPAAVADWLAERRVAAN